MLRFFKGFFNKAKTHEPQIEVSDKIETSPAKLAPAKTDTVKKAPAAKKAPAVKKPAAIKARPATRKSEK